MEFDQKEYQSVILAALLHDIGKFLHRVIGIEDLEGDHPKLGADFVSGKGVFSQDGPHSTFHRFSEIIQGDWVYKDKLEESIRKHHNGAKPWGWIVHKSDSYSTKERFREGEKVTTYPPKGPLIPLKSIFSDVFLGKPKPMGVFSFDAKILDTFDSFPKEGKNTLRPDESLALFKNFTDELLSLKTEGIKFDFFFNTLHSIFEKYLWGLPCHTHPEIADVSIFDHLKSASAIAACLYQYHCYTNTLTIKNIQSDDDMKFLLVGADLSGIQNYIYQISAITGEGGVAKRLRARSFYISALLEVTIMKILRELELPISCNLMSAGGKFIILAPNVERIKIQLQALYQYISDWLLEEFSGELYLVMDWSTRMSGGDFFRKLEKTSHELNSKEEEEPEEENNSNEHRECNFRDRLDETYFALENKKLSKFKISIHNQERWIEDKFIRKNKYESYIKGLGLSFLQEISGRISRPPRTRRGRKSFM
jgi:CRISPR-associated protein Csm1